jgi:hypothetical protein
VLKTKSVTSAPRMKGMNILWANLSCPSVTSGLDHRESYLTSEVTEQVSAQSLKRIYGNSTSRSYFLRLLAVTSFSDVTDAERAASQLLTLPPPGSQPENSPTTDTVQQARRRHSDCGPSSPQNSVNGESGRETHLRSSKTFTPTQFLGVPAPNKARHLDMRFFTILREGRGRFCRSTCRFR